MLNVLALALVVAQATAAPLPPLPIRIAIDPAALQGLPERTISATDEAGKTDQYIGVSLRDLLTKAGLPIGAAVRGKAMRIVVVVGAADDYHVVFALPELDPSYTDRVVLIADRKDGAAIPAPQGPYRLIVPGEKREARWVREVTSVDIEDAP